jgi:Holliday junction resolvase-like predicted endonuclease
MRISLQEVRKQTGLESLEEEVQSFVERGLVSANRELLEVTPRQRVMLAEVLVREGQDAQQVSRHLAWQEFEEFVETALDQSGFKSVRHVIFKCNLGRREIDILAWNDVWILVVDCKHWSRTLTHSRMKSAAEAQVERARALTERPEVMQRQGVRRIELPLIPLILTLGEPRDRLVAGVPIVGLSKFSSFLQEASPYAGGFRTLHARTVSKQSSLFQHIPSKKNNRMPNLTQNVERRRP